MEKKYFSLLMGMQINIPTVENSMEDPKSIQIELPYDLRIPVLHMLPKLIKSAKELYT